MVVFGIYPLCGVTSFRNTFIKPPVFDIFHCNSVPSLPLVTINGGSSVPHKGSPVFKNDPRNSKGYPRIKLKLMDTSRCTRSECTSVSTDTSSWKVLTWDLKYRQVINNFSIDSFRYKSYIKYFLYVN